MSGELGVLLGNFGGRPCECVFVSRCEGFAGILWNRVGCECATGLRGWEKAAFCVADAMGRDARQDRNVGEYAGDTGWLGLYSRFSCC